MARPTAFREGADDDADATMERDGCGGAGTGTEMGCGGCWCC
jgi:hypothetical protein